MLFFFDLQCNESAHLLVTVSQCLVGYQVSYFIRVPVCFYQMSQSTCVHCFIPQIGMEQGDNIHAMHNVVQKLFTGELI